MKYSWLKFHGFRFLKKWTLTCIHNVTVKGNFASKSQDLQGYFKRKMHWGHFKADVQERMKVKKKKKEITPKWTMQQNGAVVRTVWGRINAKGFLLFFTLINFPLYTYLYTKTNSLVWHDKQHLLSHLRIYAWFLTTNQERYPQSSSFS